MFGSRGYAIVIGVTAVNLLLVLAFPPYDYVSSTARAMPSFEGFRFALAEHGGRMVNTSFFTLELLAVLANAAIALLLLRSLGQTERRRQRIVLIVLAINLVVVLLFPPFQHAATVTRAVLPTFDGFYFVFGDNRDKVLVNAILYLEFCAVLINGALLWLLFKPRRKDLDEAALHALARELRR